MTFNRRFGAIARLMCATSIGSGAILIASPAEARCVASGSTLACDTTSPNPDSVAATATAGTVTVDAGATLTSTQSATLTPGGTTVSITNGGTIQTTNGTGRAINFAGANNSRDIVITNNAGGFITSADDAVRVNFNPTGGTITVNNSGTISTTNGGQALDFNAAASGSATIVINNLTSGQLLSVGQDAIRPGQGAVVNNAGLIRSDGAANNSFDGVDWQQSSGVVNNQATGTISGLRHGITSDIDVNVTNAGLILGRNGSGVGSDGTGTVVNTGTITGQWDGVATNGDGDGVDIDFIGTVVNSGTIQGLTATGVDSGGRPNSAEGVAMGGGSITNNAGATIFGGARGVLINHDTNAGGVADGATTIVNAGTIRGGTGEGILFVGNFNDSITTSGSIIGGNGVALDMGDGNDTLTVQTGATFTGTIVGGAGNDALILSGGINVGTQLLTGTSGFETLLVSTGVWTASGTQQYSGGVTIASGAGVLFSSSADYSGNSFANNGILNLGIVGSSTFTGSIGGTGTLQKSGTGTLSLGAQSFTGNMSVLGGTLVLTGNLATGTTSVVSGSTLTSALAATISTTATSVSITNDGTISNTNGTGRAINLAGSNNSRNISITNNAGGLITSADDAVRVNFNPTGGSIIVNNAGTISATNGGQALDFNAATSGAGTITINNLATGQLLSVGQDAIRPGQGAVVNNAGLIRSDGAANNSFDGVDWQQSSGVVNNQATGTISGLRHGITSDINVTVTNAGLIIGRNGSGVGSDGTGTVTNTGTITGQWDGVATNGDGDGVDIDLIGTVVNSGTIQGLTATGVDSGGRPNSAQGVAMGGGSITNTGTIFGGAQGVLVNLDTNPGGAAVGATTITNSGVIRGGTAEAIQFVGDFADSITNSGLIAGGNGRAIDMGGGNDSLTLTGGASFVGRIDGGAGNDTITLGATNPVGNDLQGAVNFENLIVTGTGWRLAQVANFDNGITIQGTGGLTGNVTTLVGPIVNNGALIVDQSSDGAFVGVLSGNGSLLKTGAGTVTIGTMAGFTGATTVGQGKLVLAGSLPGSVFVLNGATLGGNGAVGATNLASGATIAPGNSVGTITINGAFTAQAGSTYLAEVSAAGTSDLIAVNGIATIAPGARLAIVAEAGANLIGRRYTVLTATGGVSGTYTLLQDANALTEYRLGGTAGSIFVDVARTGNGLLAAAATRNQTGVASGLAALGVSNGAYAALTLNPSDAAVRFGLDQLSGEIHASVMTSMAKDAQAAQAAALGRLTVVDGPGIGVWAQGLYRTGTDNGDRTVGRMRNDMAGAIGGIDIGVADWGRIGVAGGYTRTKLYVDTRGSTARNESVHLLGYASGHFGQLTVKGVVGYAWSSIDTRRSISFTGFGSDLATSYDGSVWHGTLDAGYKLPFGGGFVEPFAAIEGYRVKRDGFAEPGAGVALTSGDRTEDFVISTLGARAETPIVERLSARGQLGWRHAFDNLSPSSLMRFTADGPAFRVTGTPLAEDAVSAAIGLDWRPTERVTVSGGYAGIIGDRTDESRFQIMLGVGF